MSKVYYYICANWDKLKSTKRSLSHAYGVPEPVTLTYVML
jgi:hypothetical protein